MPDSGLALTIGKSIADIKKTYGEPVRIDASSYGYDWWIYNEEQDSYFQLAVEDGKIVSAYGIGDIVDVSPFYIAQPIDELYSSLFFETSVDIETKFGSYRFELSEDEMNMRPLMKMGNIYVQVYLDRFTGTVSSVRYLTAETLLKQRPYELIYRGELLEEKGLTEEEWLSVEKANQQQIFDITNIMRARFDLHSLKWDESISEIAYLHSKDMRTTDYFSHTSPTTGDLENRLELGDITYSIAGENIAANYVDAIAVMEGWLNSKSHRDALLNEEFSYLGVGVYQKSYTQDFTGE